VGRDSAWSGGTQKGGETRESNPPRKRGSANFAMLSATTSYRICVTNNATEGEKNRRSRMKMDSSRKGSDAIKNENHATDALNDSATLHPQQ